jgi:hypothetical protein
MERLRVERLKIERLRISFDPNWNDSERNYSEWKDLECKDCSECNKIDYTPAYWTFSHIFFCNAQTFVTNVSGQTAFRVFTAKVKSVSESFHRVFPFWVIPVGAKCLSESFESEFFHSEFFYSEFFLSEWFQFNYKFFWVSLFLVFSLILSDSS